MKILGLSLLLLLPLQAALTFDQTLKEVRAGIDQRKVACDFEFANQTDKPVEIARYESTCSCLLAQVQDGKLLYQPGETGVIRAVFDMGNYTGTIDKALRVWLKGDPIATPSIILTTRIHIPVLVEIDPKTARWDTSDQEKPTAKVISITMNGEDPIRVTSVESGNPTFQTDLREIEPGRKYELHVTPTTLTTPALGVIQIRTDAPSPRHATQRAFALVRKPVAGSAND